VSDEGEPGWMAVGVLFTDVEGRVLLVQPSYKSSWEVPGGMLQSGESPRSAARRAVREELGMEPTIGSLLVLDWIPANDDAAHGLMLLYDGGSLDDADASRIRLARGDLNAYGFADLDSAVGLLPDALERRVKIGLRARRLGRAVELEDGWPQIARELAVDL
jgi:8-oxo-dGTP diphosphatase